MPLAGPLLAPVVVWPPVPAAVVVAPGVSLQPLPLAKRTIATAMLRRCKGPKERNSPME